MTDPRTALEALVKRLDALTVERPTTAVVEYPGYYLAVRKDAWTFVEEALDDARAALAPVASPEAVGGERWGQRLCGCGQTLGHGDHEAGRSDHHDYAPTPPPPAPESAEALRDALVRRYYRTDPSHHTVGIEYREGRARLTKELDAIISAAKAEERADIGQETRAKWMSTLAAHAEARG